VCVIVRLDLLITSIVKELFPYIQGREGGREGRKQGRSHQAWRSLDHTYIYLATCASLANAHWPWWSIFCIRKWDACLSFAFVYPGQHGHNVIQNVG
jgi:hypothetical protein